MTGTPDAETLAGGWHSQSRYRPRTVTFLGPRWAETRLLKEYAIAADRGVPRDVVVSAGRVVIESLLDSQAPFGASSFGIIHEGEDACYYTAWWWERECVLHQAARLASLEHPDATEALWAGAVACTWELVPVAHERQAWVRHLNRRHAHDSLDQWAHDGWTGRA